MKRSLVLEKNPVFFMHMPNVQCSGNINVDFLTESKTWNKNLDCKREFWDQILRCHTFLCLWPMQWDTTKREFFYNFIGILCPVLFWVVCLSYYLFLAGEDFDYFPVRGFCGVEGGFLVCLFTYFYWNA